MLTLVDLDFRTQNDSSLPCLVECELGFTARTWRENREEALGCISPNAHNSSAFAKEIVRQSVCCWNCGLEDRLKLPRLLAALGCDAWGVSVEEISV